MSNELVHAIGSTIYVVILLMFLWVGQIPRTNPGPGWWTLAIACALLARLLILVLPSFTSMHLALIAYLAVNMIEKPLLLIGMQRFFQLESRMGWIWIGAVLAGAWLFYCWAMDISSTLRGTVFCAFNAGYIFSIGWIAYRKRDEAPHRVMWFVAMFSMLLALHWLTVTPIIHFVPTWFNGSFMLGTSLALFLYLSLLAAVLLQFQQRLLDAEAKALELAFQDPLTGLNNKRYMNTLFEKALILANRPHQLLALFYIDLDNFKPINDSAGHRVGDEVLKTVARRLRKATRSTDICARIGGDEFVVIATQLEREDQIESVAEKLLLELTRAVEVGNQSYRLGASIGISLCPRHGDNLATLMELADSAMYQIKRGGKNGYQIHHAG